VEACCATQETPLACLSWVQGLSMLGGDAECEKLKTDESFLRAYASRPLCNFD
jgi:hypothetical protein